MAPIKKIYIILGIWVALVMALIFLVISPILMGIRNNKEVLISIKNETASLIAEINNLGIVRKQYQEYSPNLKKIDTLLVNSEVPIDFIRFLEKLASDCGVSILISSGRAQDSSNKRWIRLYYQLYLEGSYLNFSRFLDKMENADYLIEAQDMAVRSVISENGRQEIAANFLIKVLAR